MGSPALRAKACAPGRLAGLSAMAFPRLRSLVLLLPFLLDPAAGLAAEIPALGPGSFAVATTNLEVRPQADAKAMFDFMNGKSTSTGPQYLTDILVHPDAVPTVQLDVPADAGLFGKLAGTRLPLVLLIVYPTTRDNPRADYVYPYTETGDRTFTHMEQPGDTPILAHPATRHPLIVMSGGYNTHGLWHLSHLKELAAHGYIVVDVFHGDGRGFSFAANLTLRPLAVRAALDFVLQHPDFGPAIDPNRIGATGESAGGHTVLALLGGTDPTGRVAAGADPRVKAAFGVVPFMGGSFGFWPFKVDAWHFGEDHGGLRGVRKPFFAVYGGKDANVPPEGVEAGVRALSGPATAVMLDDESHLLTNPAQRDVRTWELLFFDYWLRDDATARQQLEQGTSVQGGVKDHRTYHHAPPVSS